VARSGEEIVNPITHQRIIYHKTSRETNGELFQMEFIMEPNSFIVGGPHIHPAQSEEFNVLSGAVNFIISGKQQVVPAGESRIVQPYTVHDWWNKSGESSHVMVTFRPAKHYETYFETIFGLARDGKTTDRGFPHLLQAAVIYYDFRESVRPPQPWARILTALFLPIVAAIGKALGYRSWYPKYTHPATKPV